MSQTMNGKERILKALALGEPDTVPVFEMGINEASIVNLGKQFTDDVPPIKHITDMDLEEQLRYMDLLSLILKELIPQAREIADQFRRHNLASLDALRPHFHDEAKTVAIDKSGREELEESLRRDRESRAKGRGAEGWH